MSDNLPDDWTDVGAPAAAGGAMSGGHDDWVDVEPSGRTIAAGVSGKVPLSAPGFQPQQREVAPEKFAQGQEMAGHLDALLAGTAQGASFGMTDEIGAALRGAAAVLKGGQYGPAYDQALQTARDNLAKLKDAAPKTFVAGEVAGGLGTAAAAPVKLVAAAPTLATKVAASSALGGAQGAAYGAGNSEGGAENRLEGAAKGAIPGAIIGAAAPVVAAVAPAMAQAGKSLLRVASPSERAVSLIARAADRSGVSPDDFGAAIKAANTKGVPLVPGDMGPSLTRLGRTVETVPGAGSELATDFLTERQADQGGRLLGQLRTHLGDPADYWKSMDELDAARRSAAKPLYDAAYAKPAVDGWTPELAGLLNRPSMKDAYARAAKIAAEEGRDPRELGLTFNEAGDPMFLVGADATGKIPSTQTLDYVKRGLDDVIEGFRNPTTGKLALDEAGRAINNTRAQFVGLLRNGNPDYAAALDSWAGPSHAMDVLDRARDFARGDIEMTAKQFAEMTPADQDLARVGVARELQKVIQGSDDGINKVRRIFGSPTKRDTLRVFFPDEASWNQFSAIMGAENQMAKNAQMITGGSATGRIGAEQADAADKATAVLHDIATGGVGGAVKSAIRTFFNTARGIDEPTSLELARRLFSTDPAAAASLASELRGVIASRKGAVSVGQRRILTALGGAQASGVPLIAQQRDPAAAGAQPFNAGGIVTEHKDLRSLLADKRPLKQILAETKAKQAAKATADAATAHRAANPNGTGYRDDPMRPDAAAHVEKAATIIGTNAVGRPQLAHVVWQTIPITIEVAKGGTRTAKDGAWEVTDFPAHYGRLKRTKGADNEQVDVYFGDHPESARVFVFDQMDPKTRRFDEHKAMLGFTTPAAARDAYRRAFSDGSGDSRVGAVTTMSVSQFKNWLKRGKRTKPLGHLPPPRSGASRAAQPPASDRSLRPATGAAAT